MHPLFKAISDGKLDDIKKLSKKYDISKSYDEVRGMTPLHSAIYNQNADAVYTLLELGADPEVENPISGHTFISMWARQYIEFEYWDELEDIFFAYCEYGAWKRSDWCHDIVHLIFFQGWPKAADYFKQSFV